jgi:predicted esterase
VLLAVLVAFALCVVPTTARAEAAKSAASAKSAAWCGADTEALPNDVCYVDGRANGARRTLVIWLHGVIPTSSNWSWNHQHMLRRVAKQHGIELLFPRGIAGRELYAWPGTQKGQTGQEESEQALIDQWMSAKDLLEKRENRPFDEVFIFGFSSGAYFASSLAMRGRVDVDGYAVFAGGQPMPPPAGRADRSAHMASVFVGVCANDRTTAAHSRAFAGSLAAAGIPRMVSEQKVGHDLSEVHFAQALSYLHAHAHGHANEQPVAATRSVQGRTAT